MVWTPITVKILSDTTLDERPLFGPGDSVVVLVRGGTTSGLRLIDDSTEQVLSNLQSGVELSLALGAGRSVDRYTDAHVAPFVGMRAKDGLVQFSHENISDADLSSKIATVVDRRSMKREKDRKFHTAISAKLSDGSSLELSNDSPDICWRVSVYPASAASNVRCFPKAAVDAASGLTTSLTSPRVVVGAVNTNASLVEIVLSTGVVFTPTLEKIAGIAIYWAEIPVGSTIDSQFVTVGGRRLQFA